MAVANLHRIQSKRNHAPTSARRAAVRAALHRGDLRALAAANGLHHSLFVRVLDGSSVSARAWAMLQERAAERRRQDAAAAAERKATA